jgi:hypothetical protein
MPRRQPHQPATAARLLAALLLCSASLPALAFRPLLTDDASVNPVGECQLETWYQSESALNLWAVAPACGIGANLEIGVEFTRTSPRLEDRGGFGLQLKAALPALTVGTWDFGAKVKGFALKNPATTDGKPDLYQGFLLATGTFTESVTVHLNLGGARDTAERRDALVYGAAVMYTFGDKGFVFAELAGDHRSGAIRNAGARWWLIGDRLGVDFSVARQAGVPDSTLYTIGVAYYGLGAFD